MLGESICPKCNCLFPTQSLKNNSSRHVFLSHKAPRPVGPPLYKNLPPVVFSLLKSLQLTFPLLCQICIRIDIRRNAGFCQAFRVFSILHYNSSAFGRTVTASAHDKSPLARGGCLLALCFLTVCAVNAQPCLNCYLTFSILPYFFLQPLWRHFPTAQIFLPAFQ